MNYVKFDNRKIYPSKIVCIGRNYFEHILELDNELPENMVVFNKPNSAISDTLYYFSEHCRFEGEICLLVEQGAIAGIGFGLDLTHADIQNKMKQKGLPWERAKAFDHSAVFGDFVRFDRDISKIRFELYINNTLMQSANHNLMIYKPLEMIEEIQSFMSLEDGDIIMSGTPKGVGSYSAGDLFIGKIFYDDTLVLESQWSVKSTK